MSVEVDGVPLSAAQVTRFERLVSAAKKAGADEAGAVSSAEGSWRILYSVSDGKWERKAIAVTSRGVKFAQRPGEVAGRTAPGVDSRAEESRVSRILLIERAMLPAGAVRIVQEAAEAPKEGEKPLPKGVLMRVDATLGQVDTVNRNNRVYPRELMARELKAAAKKGGAMKERGMFALADHPQFSWFGGGDPPSGSTRAIAGIQNTAEFASAASAESPDVVGTIDIIDSENGREIAAVVRAGGSIGISQRGWGTVEEDVFTDAAGRQVVAGVVQQDYHLEAWDFVIGPSADAGVTGYLECAESAEEPNQMTLESIKANHPALYAAIMAEGASAEKLSVASAVEAAKAEVSAAAATEKAAAVAEAKAAGIAEGKAAAPALSPEDAAIVAAVKEAAGTATDLPAFVKEAAARPLPAAVEEAKAPGAKSAALLKVLKEKAGHNVKVYTECAGKAFSADGAPAMEPAALEAAIAESLKTAVAPAAAPPRPGDGRVGEDGSDAAATAADKEQLAEVNSIRARGGLPALTKLPS